MHRLSIFALLLAAPAFADDWPMGGRQQSRNPVSPEKNPPVDWHLGTDKLPAKNIRWTAEVGGRAIGGPVVANGLVWIGRCSPTAHSTCQANTSCTPSARRSNGLVVGRWCSHSARSLTTDHEAAPIPTSTLS